MSSSSDRQRSISKLVLIAYLVHLILPLLLLLDVILAWQFPSSNAALNPDLRWWYDFGTTGQFALVASTVWLTLGLGVLVAGRVLNWFSFSRLQGPLVTAYAVFFTLVLVEVGLQIVSQRDSDPALWPPGQEALLAPDPNLMPGVQGAARFTGNDVGLRGPSYPVDDNVFKIITIGGSTTESLYLDGSEEWPHLLMEGLNSKQSGTRVWVGNGGQSGRNMVDHLELVRVLPVVSEAQLLIFLIGINDLQPVLSFEGRPTQETLERSAAIFRNQVLDGGQRARPTRPYFKRWDLFALAKRSASRVLDKIAPTKVLSEFGVGPGIYIEAKRQQRANSPTAPLPDLGIGLAEYRHRIQAVAGECQTRGLRCLFVTQPTMWREDLPLEEMRLLWFGWIRGPSSPTGYLTVGDLAYAMDTFNQELLDVCIQNSLECYDLASVVPKDTTVFYDDAHFNERGGRIIAQRLTDYLLSTPPFSEPAP